MTSQRRVAFRGGIASGFFRASWPFGLLTVDEAEVRISSAVGSDAVAVRDGASAVVLRRAGLFGMGMEIQRDGRIGPRFFPTDPGRVLRSLERFGWPVRVDVSRSRRDPRLLLVVAVLLVALAVGEAVVKSNRADAMKARSRPGEGRVEAVDRSAGAKRLGTVAYTVDGRRFYLVVVLTDGTDSGDLVAIRYDPHDPGVAWAEGDDPPGTGDWTFGPLGVVLAIALVPVYRRRRSLTLTGSAADTAQCAVLGR